MSKRKQPWEQLSKSETKKAAEKATGKTTSTGKSPKRKMLRVGDDEHALAKKAAALMEIGLQEYIEQLIRDDVARRFPELLDGGK